MRYTLLLITLLLFTISCKKQPEKVQIIEKAVTGKPDTGFIDCAELKVKYDSLLKRSAYLQSAGDSLLRLSITYGFVGKAVKRYLALGKSRPPLAKYEGGWIARALRIE